MNCQEVEELAAFYAIGALPAPEMAEIAAHLESCREHEATLVRLKEAASALALAAEERAAPAGLKTRLMASIRPQTAAAASPVTAPREGKQHLRLPALSPRLGFAALLIVIAALLAWNIELQLSRTSFSRSLAGDGAVGQLFYVERPEFGILSVEGLPSPGPDRTYQIWCSTDQGYQSRGTVAMVQHGQGLALIHGDMPRHRAVFLTVEPSGGSAQPTGPTVLTTQ